MHCPDEMDRANPGADLPELHIRQAELGGWYVVEENCVVACFSSGHDLAEWVRRTCRELEQRAAAPDDDIDLPTALLPKGETSRRPWRIFSGGRA